MRLEYTLSAQESLRDIYEFRYSHDPRAAEKILNRITDEVDRIKTMPLVASVELSLDHLPRKYRSLVIMRRYKAIYFVEEDTIVVTDFWDCRQDPSTLMRLFKGR